MHFMTRVQEVKKFRYPIGVFHVSYFKINDQKISLCGFSLMVWVDVVDMSRLNNKVLKTPLTTC